MLEQHPSFTYEQTHVPEGTPLEDGTELDLKKSQLRTPDEGRALAAATRAAEMLAHPEVERPKEHGHEQAIISTQYVLAVRRAELEGRESLFDLAS